jgi:CelD/BcsL family acetyltransferase involved in cellulose biosynthesis
LTKDIDYVPILISAAPTPLYLNAISKDQVEKLKNKVNFGEDEPKYVLNLKNFKNHEDYLMTLKKNTRRNLRKDRNRILKQNPKIVINNFSDLDILIELAKKRFKERGESVDWDDPRRVETFKNVIKFSGKSYRARMIKVTINEKAAGVDLVCLFRKTYFAVKCGYDVSQFSGIGNFVNLYEIDDAIKLGMEKIDFLQNNYQWKNKYFTPLPLYKLEKK